MLGLINFLARRSSSCLCSSSCSAIESQITGRKGGSALGSVSIFIASPRSGGNPAGRVSGKTSLNSLWTMSWTSGGSVGVGVSVGDGDGVGEGAAVGLGLGTVVGVGILVAVAF